MTYLFDTLNSDAGNESTEGNDLITGLKDHEYVVNLSSTTENFSTENTSGIEADAISETLLPIINDLVEQEDLNLSETEINNILVEANDFINNNFSSSDLDNLFSNNATDTPVEPSENEPFDKIYIFGDSFSDPGNIFNSSTFLQPFEELLGRDIPVTPPSPPYFEGRFSNGPVWTENLENDLGLTSTPASELSVFNPALPIPSPITITPDGVAASPFFNGATTTQSVNFAYGAAQTGTNGAGEFGDLIPGVTSQVDSFIKDHQQVQQSADPEALYVIWAGANDYYTNGGDPEATVDNLETSIESLYDTGARNFLVADLPDLGKLPAVTGLDNPQVADALTNFTEQHNSLLAGTLNELDNSLNEINLVPLDVSGLFENVLTNPENFGFTNVSDPFLDPVTLNPSSSNPDEYLFWDDTHPTAAFHDLLGDFALDTLMSTTTLTTENATI
ncbi:phospholipase [Pleurocapsa sp. CCALA 161]|uniref:SGNH/GDSL hydrolase family protein n=1 Tax=Pleurocapsa sp. CCALA 161 TaxID=2107688 RepID=UPI000D079FF7|nr:SGNH/GDSL hydrolase family protein [Pleurocapsa sp. CCALA 161]PSB12300.1 phospholipase [Pleurocapsa sp. CCALA 161]